MGKHWDSQGRTVKIGIGLSLTPQEAAWLKERVVKEDRTGANIVRRLITDAMEAEKQSAPFRFTKWPSEDMEHG